MTAVAFYRWIAKSVAVAMLVIICGLFAFAVLDWAGVIPYDGYQPKKMVFLTGGMLLQSIAMCVVEKSRKAVYALLGGSIVLLFFAVTANG